MLDLETLLAARELSLGAIALLAVLAFLLALWSTPIARDAAIKFGIVDKPDGRLKTHRDPIPYLGGLAVYLSTLVALLLAFDFDPQLLALLLAGALVLLLGLIDDLGALSPRVKFAGQLLAVWVLLKAGAMTHIATLPGWANACVSAFWLVAVMNAINIIDIMDGLAVSVAGVASSVLVVVALMNELPEVAATSAAIAGACGGFYLHNRPPARIYLGDAGSLFLGLMLGGLTMVVSYSKLNGLAVLNPLLILSVPLFDTSFVSAVRMWRGDSPFRGSPDHYALRLRKKGLSVPRIVHLSALSGALTGGLAILNMRLEWQESLSLYAVTAALFLGIALWLAGEKMP